jgi:hypothetical protein
MKRHVAALLCATALSVLPAPAQADPLSIGVAFLVNIGWTGAITGLGATLVGAAIIGVAALGVSLAAGALLGPQNTASRAKPSERQATIRQAVGPRVRFYGRNKVGGTMWFFETAGSLLYVGITLNEGEIEGIVETWLNDQEVALDVDGYVLSAPYVPGGTKVARMFFKDGASDQTVHSVLDSAFASVTADHRLRGVANALATFQEVNPEDVSAVYPNYIPQVRVVMDASIVKSVRTGSMIYSDNAADVIYDYLTAVDGAGFPYGAGFAESEIDLASFQAFANLSDQPVDLKAGGTVDRYKIWTSYALNEQMRDVLPRLLSACDGELYLTTAGKIAIRGGQWVAPTLTLDGSLGHIVSAEFRKGQNELAAFNELTVKYTEPSLDYQEAEAEMWVDSANQALRGKALSAELEVYAAPNHSQARRIAKIYTHKKNPRWSGKVITNFYGLNAVGEETVTIKFAPLGIDEDFAVHRLRFLDGLTGVELTVSSLSEDAYAWDEATEEGAGPSIPADTTDSTPTDPVDNLVGTAGTGSVLLEWDLPASANVAGARIYRNTSDDFGTATKVTTRFGGPSESLSYTDTVPPASYWYFLVAINGSGVESTEEGTGEMEVS